MSNYVLSNSASITKEHEKDKKDYAFRVSNWMTQLLSQTPIGPLDEHHVDATTLALSKKKKQDYFIKWKKACKHY